MTEFSGGASLAKVLTAASYALQFPGWHLARLCLGTRQLA